MRRNLGISNLETTGGSSETEHALTRQLEVKVGAGKICPTLLRRTVPANSPDLNPLDYSIWNEIVQGMNWDKVECKEWLKAQILLSVNKVRAQVVLDSCSSFYTRSRRLAVWHRATAVTCGNKNALFSASFIALLSHVTSLLQLFRVPKLRQ